ncbi:FAD-dependent hydroxylase [Phormidium sp. LEGE 05292]|uniref:FAD-dependent hydroxylase n=1 Tax=[Phormidium] sp. LEGE 05292 TaxID=767427 RepID=UPI00188141E4|nr:FAD-dependent hydroxylase [Phormidium sp. LEGE 05292]MBE9226486.1 FAD-dependent hydroxylase [Phormidium sp. LEGE 05292]
MLLTPTSEIKLDYDLAIVGGGIVGATLAAALKDSGLSVALIEAQVESVSVAKGRAYAISLLSGRIFDGIGIWDKIEPQITTYQQVQLSDADYPKIVQFHPPELGTNGLGYTAEHRVLLTVLQEFLQTCPNVSYLCPAEVIKADYQKDFVEIQLRLNGELKTIKTRLLVGADGAKSRIRQAAGIKTHGWPYWQSCVVATIKPEKPHNNVAYERFWPSGPMGVLPLTENRFQIVWTWPHAEAKAMQELDETEFLQKLEYYTGGKFGKLELLGDRYIFPVQLMQCDRYTLPRLALIGDAAHGCHPVAGQGMNLGIRDAAALAQILQTAQQNGEDIGNIQVLKHYETWRKRENWVILGFTDFLDRIFSNQFLPLVIIRRFGLWMLRNITPIKKYALQLMTGLRGRPPQLSQM